VARQRKIVLLSYGGGEDSKEWDNYQSHLTRQARGWPKRESVKIKTFWTYSLPPSLPSGSVMNLVTAGGRKRPLERQWWWERRRPVFPTTLCQPWPSLLQRQFKWPQIC
jgi:hypothetical protein